jgi:spore germination protein (amino acid permease)
MDKLTFKHFFFIMCASSIVSLKTYPGIFMRDSGRDSWVAVIISALIIIICFDYIIRIWVNRKCSSLKEVFELGFGKFLGKILLIIFAFTLFFTMVECASVETSVIHVNLFIESPQWYILFFILLPGLYTIKKGKNSVMVVIIMCMVISIINGINLYFLTFPFKKYNRLLPVFAQGINFNFFVAIVKSLGLFSTSIISLAYLSQINNTRRLRRCALISLIFITQMIIVSTNGILSTFTVERANSITYPKLIQTQLISYFGFIASGEFYVIFQVLAGWFAKYVVTFFALINILKELKIEKLFNMDILPYCITGLVYVLSFAATYNLIDLFQILNIYSYVCLINFLLIPIVIFTVFAIRTRCKKSK